MPRANDDRSFRSLDRSPVAVVAASRMTMTRGRRSVDHADCGNRRAANRGDGGFQRTGTGGFSTKILFPHGRALPDFLLRDLADV